MFNLFSRFFVKNSASLPEGTRIYAIGDIHGCYDLLQGALQKIDNDILARPGVSDIKIIFLGDYIDRGPDSRKVIEELSRKQKGAGQYICIKGNHEDTLLQFIENPSVLDSWQNYGGLQTLESYGVNLRMVQQGNDAVRDAFLSVIPDSHLEFYRNLQLSYSAGEYFFCHAGIKPEVPLDQQSEDDLMWIRNEFLQYSGQHEKVIVHGHTPVPEPELWKNRINIDTGAYSSGRLTCLMLEGERKVCL